MHISAMWMCAAVVAMAPAVLAFPTSGNSDKVINTINAPLVKTPNPSFAIHFNKAPVESSIHILPRTEPIMLPTIESTVLPRQNPGQPGFVAFATIGTQDSCTGKTWGGGAMGRCLAIDQQHWEPHHCIIQYHGAVCTYYDMEDCTLERATYDSTGPGSLVISPLPAIEVGLKAFRCARSKLELEALEEGKA